MLHANCQESALTLVCYWRCLLGRWGQLPPPPPPTPTPTHVHFIISLVIPSIPWALSLSILFMTLSTRVFLLCQALIPLYFPVLELFAYRVTCRNLRIFLEFLLCLVWFLQIFSSCSLLLVYFCVYWAVLDPFLLLMFPVLIPFFSSVPLFYISFSIICWVPHSISCLSV